MGSTERKRPRGAGTVYDHYGMWWIQYYHQGKRHRESSGSKIEGVAWKLLTKRLGEIGRGQFVPGADKITLDDLKNLVVEDYKANEKRSLDRVEIAWKHLEAHLAYVRAIDIPKRARTYIVGRREEKAANATIQYELRMLARGFRLAVTDGLLLAVPAFPSVSVKNARQGFVTDEQEEKILRVLPDHLKTPTRFAFLTGWRPREIKSLEWRQVDLVAGTIRLEAEASKNDEAREIPYRTLPDLAAIIEDQRGKADAWQRERGEILRAVFWRPTRSGAKPLLDFRGAWKTATERAGIPGILFYDLRRSAVRNMERAGVPRSVAMRITGHKTESIYRRYAIAAQPDLEEGFAKLAEQRQVGKLAQKRTKAARKG